MAVSISGEGVISGSSNYSFDSKVSVGGTLTYEDVTSVDSVGIITAQSGIRVTGGTVGIGTDDPGSHKLHLYGASNSDIRMTATGDDIINIFANSNRSSANDVIFAIKGEWNGTQVANIKINAGDDTTNKDDGYITFNTRESGAGSSTERIRITSAGKVGVNETAPAADLVVKQSGNTFTTQSQTVALFQRSSTAGHGVKIAIVAGTGGSSDINFGDTDDEDIGIIQYFHTDNSLRITANASERLRINSNGTTQFTPEGSTSNPYLLIDTSGDNARFNAAKSSGNCGLIFVTQNSGTATERLRITYDGKFGFKTTSPDYTVDINGELGITEGQPVTWHDGSGNAAAQIYGDSSSNLIFRTGVAAMGERMRITPGGDSYFTGNVGINKAAPTQALDVVGRIIKTEYEPGELIECLETIANGIQCTLSSGSYTPTNVTATQDLTSSYADINGSVFTYNVPAGTKRLVYDFFVFMKDKDVGPLLHFRGLTTADGSSTYAVVNDSRSTWRGATASADYQHWIHNRMVLFDNSSEDLNDGLLNSLGGTTRKIKFQCREYSGSYEGQLHTTNNYDGAGTDILVRPHIRISAYA
tara:strand:- start:1975 stop:3735 length:1761 start_codon:yes stop_codon:yes gene_type:complete